MRFDRLVITGGGYIENALKYTLKHYCFVRESIAKRLSTRIRLTDSNFQMR